MANVAVYLLLDTIPVEALLHKRLLSLFGNITRLECNHPLRQLAMRQLAMKTSKSNSWFAQVARVAEKYEIDIHHALLYPWPKPAWKEYLKGVIYHTWKAEMLTKASSMSSLKWWIVGDNNIKVWNACKGRKHIVEAAMIRARMMTGKYILQSTRSRYKQYKVDPTCPLCESMEEDLIHLLVVCTELHCTRSRNTQGI